jgi:hypothetical protein
MFNKSTYFKNVSIYIKNINMTEKREDEIMRIDELLEELPK